MMRRLGLVSAALAAVLFAVSCTDARHSVLPTDPTSTADISIRDNLRQCLTPQAIDQLARVAWGPRHPNYFAVVARISPILFAMQRNDTATARTKAFQAVDFIQKLQGRRRFRGNPPPVDAIIQAIFCLAAVNYSDPDNSFLILPSDQPQVVVSGDANAGVQLPANPVSEPTLLTVTKITTTFPLGGGPLNTKLDQYPGYYEFVKQSATNAPLTQPVVVAVCPSITVPDSIRNRLRLGHQASFGFEVTPPAPANFLNCPPSIASGNTGSQWLKVLASLVMPREAHAASTARFGTGGVGGSASEFSPFAPVDPVLSFGGGVGGSASEFLLMPTPVAPPTTGDKAAPSGPNKNNTVRVAPSGGVRNLQVAPLLPGAPFMNSQAPVVDCSVAAINAAIIPACRPLVTLTTLQGTPFNNVPITWSVTSGGGTISPEDYVTLGCGTFGSSASTITGTFGKAGVCWTTGPATGVNKVVATPSLGGDAIPGVSFYPTSQTFTVTTSLTTPTATVTGGGSFPYDGTAHVGGGTCSDGLTPVVTYSGGSAPVNVGTSTVTVTCGAGNPLFVTVSSSATITITPRAATATAGSGSLTYGSSASALPCVVGGLLPADAGSVTCTTGVGATSGVGSYATFPVVSPASPLNYSVSATGGSVTYTPYVTSACFGAPVTSNETRTVGVAKGTVVSVTCTLNTATGGAVAGGAASIQIEDYRPAGPTSSPVTVFSASNAFAPLGGGVYGYSMDTNQSIYLSTRLYRITATWNDGSTVTVGWIHVQ
jgi:hypothetical protein